MKNTIKLFFFIACVGSVIKSQGQVNIKCATDAELAQKKQLLLSQSNFKELISLQAELNLRKQNKKSLDSLKQLLPSLVSAEKFVEAAAVKEKMDKIQLVNSQRINNCKEYNSALKNEDYLKANQYKKLIISSNSASNNDIPKKEKAVVKSAQKTEVNQGVNTKKTGMVWNQNKVKKEKSNTGITWNKNKVKKTKTDNKYKPAKKDLSLGFVLGYNRATQIGYAGSFKRKGIDHATGVLFGLYGAQLNNKNWGVRMGIEYSSVKNKINSQRVKFLSMPTLIDYYIKDRSTFYFGPQYNYSFSKKKFNTKNFISAKLGFTYKVGKKMHIDVGYARGVTNMLKLGESYKAKMHFLTFKVGYRLK